MDINRTSNERLSQIREHDFPILLEFHSKHALGPLTRPSCLVCGRVPEQWPPAIQHAELPGIVVCHPCRDRATHETRADPACIDCIELKNALAAAVGVANEARECHDRDQDMRVMKLLMALAGHVPKYRADTDHIHDVLRRAVERLTSPAHAQECDFAQGECTCGADLAAGERNRAALKANEPPGDRHDRSRQCAVTAQDPTRAPGGSAESEPEV